MGIFDIGLRFAKQPSLLRSKVNGKEEIYCKLGSNYKIFARTGKYYIIVEDEEIGKRLYKVLKKIKELNLTFGANSDYRFTLVKYKASLRRSVQWFCVQYHYLGDKYNGDITQHSKIEKLAVINEFVSLMIKNGFYIDETVFDCTKCEAVSEFLSFFKHSSEREKLDYSEEERNYRTISSYVRYIHYRLAGRNDFDEFYEKLDSITMFYKYSELPYHLPIVRVLYEYYKNNALMDIFSQLYYAYQEYKYYDYDEDFLVDISSKYLNNLELIEEQDDCKIYTGGIKILKNASEEYQEFLKARFKNLKQNNIFFVEQVEALIIDMSGIPIGYKFTLLQRSVSAPILDMEFVNQKELIDYAEKLKRFFEEIGKINANRHGNKRKYQLEGIVFSGISTREFAVFKFVSLEDIFSFFNLSEGSKKKIIVKTAFEWLIKFIEQKYGLEKDEEWLMQKSEIRYLLPSILKTFISYVLTREETYLDYGSFFRFLITKKLGFSGDFYYDAGFEYDPSCTIFSFKHEVEKTYNTTIHGKQETYLPDGRKLVILDSEKSVETFKKKEERLRKLVSPDENVRLVEVSEVIIDAENLDMHDMYTVVGYITQPLKGVALNFNEINKLDNKELLRVIAYIFCKYNRFKATWGHIMMDNNYIFYINYLEIEDIETEPNESSAGIGKIVKGILKKFEEEGYNPFAFVGLNVEEYANGTELAEYLLKLADSFDAYCGEHKVYYNSNNKMCPVCLGSKIVVPDNFTNNLKMVISDEVGTHYKINTKYCIKIYSEQLTPEVREALKENALSIIYARITENPFNLHQDCFIPYKIAVTSKGSFVGYVYEAINLESVNGSLQDVCIDLADMTTINNLPRLKSLIRFLLQIKEFIDTYKFQIVNPFSHVFLNTSHKKQVQILNIDCISTKRMIVYPNEMEANACEYVCKIMKLDPSLDTGLKIEKLNLKKLLAALSAFRAQLTKYCRVHNQYYSSNYVCCPRCIEPKKQSNYLSFRKKTSFIPEMALNEGGEALIFDSGKNKVEKVFKENAVDLETKSVVLYRILAKKDILEAINCENHKYKFIIPQILLVDTDTNVIFGYEMEKVSDAFAISILRDKAEVEKLGFTKKDIFDILITMGEGIETLHSRAKMYIGDLNGRNILFDKDKNVYFIDFDGMGIDEIAPEFCTDGYIDPVSKKNHKITMEDDWYSYAVHVFYYLTYTHPFNGVYYEKQGKNRVMLEIPEKMEKRISLLGKQHAMKPPAIAISWEWMSKELKDMFLSIFEGDCRESIVPLLKCQYDAFINELGNNATVEIYRLSENFVAVEHKYFSDEVISVINPEAVICKRGSSKYIKVLIKENGEVKDYCKINFQWPTVESVTLSDDKKMVFIIAVKNDIKEIVAISIDRHMVVYTEQIPKATRMIVKDQGIYYLGSVNEVPVILKRKIFENGEVQNETIRIEKNDFKWFSVEGESKFIFIREAGDFIDELYCNGEKFLTMKTKLKRTHSKTYNILYDKKTKTWLIINNGNTVIVIKNNGETIDLSSEIGVFVDADNIDSVNYINGNIYIPCDGELVIFSVKKNVLKRMTCEGIMSPKSKIFDINSEGYSVLTENTFYVVRKG